MPYSDMPYHNSEATGLRHLAFEVDDIGVAILDWEAKLPGP